MQGFISDSFPKERGFEHFSNFIFLVIRGEVKKSHISFSVYLPLDLLDTYIICREQCSVFLETRTVVEFDRWFDDRSQLLFKILSVSVADFFQMERFSFFPHLCRN